MSNYFYKKKVSFSGIVEVEYNVSYILTKPEKFGLANSKQIYFYGWP